MTTLPETAALVWTERLIALAVVLQAVELIQIRQAFSDSGLWRWELVSREFACFPRPLQWLLDRLLRYPNILCLLVAQILAALLLFSAPHPVASWFLLVSTVLVSARWRGTLNGGSDYMTVIVLTGAAVGRTFAGNSDVVFGALCYIAIHLCSSYFVAGVTKLNRANWRNGSAFRTFLLNTIYQPGKLEEFVSAHPTIAPAAGWGGMLFETLFPLALSSPGICQIFIVTALVFHFANFYVFGLNRFFFAWAAAYPALYYLSHLRQAL